MNLPKLIVTLLLCLFAAAAAICRMCAAKGDVILSWFRDHVKAGLASRRRKKDKSKAAHSGESINLPPVEAPRFDVSDEEDYTGSNAPVPQPDDLPIPAHQPKEDALPSMSTCSALAEKLHEEDLRGLVSDRLCDISEEEADLQAWALSVVDLMDELRLMRPSYSTEDAETIALLETQLDGLLREHNCERIDCNEWTPTHQRAIRIERTLPAGERARILSKGASGLVVENRLLRKQEVTLNLPPDT